MHFLCKFLFNDDTTFKHRPLGYFFFIDCLRAFKLYRSNLGFIEAWDHHYGPASKTIRQENEKIVMSEIKDNIIFTKPIAVSSQFVFMYAQPFAVLSDPHYGLCLGIILEEFMDYNDREAICVGLSCLEIFNMEIALIYKVKRVTNYGRTLTTVYRRALLRGSCLSLLSNYIIEGYTMYLIDFFKRIYELYVNEEMMGKIYKLLLNRERAAEVLPCIQTLAELREKLEDPLTEHQRRLIKIQLGNDP